eukprot:6555979-Karenia_brevis.AAC.1
MLIRLKGKKLATQLVEQAKALKPKCIARKKELQQCLDAADFCPSAQTEMKHAQKVVNEVKELKKLASPHLEMSEVK